MTEPNAETPPEPRRRRRLRAWILVVSILLLATAIGSWVAHRAGVEDWPARVVLVVGDEAQPIAFSPDGRTFLVSGKGKIVPWDVSTGVAGKPWAIPDNWMVYQGVYSPDGRTFATNKPAPPEFTECHVFLFDAASGLQRAQLATRQKYVDRLAFSGDGRSLRAVLTDEESIREVVTWDLSTGEETSRRVLEACPSFGFISPDGRVMISRSKGKEAITVWDLDADRPTGEIPPPTASGLQCGVAFSDDGRTLAIGRSDGAVELWDVATFRLMKTIPIHVGGDVNATFVRFGPGGRTLLSTGHVETLAPTPSLLERLTKIVTGKGFSTPDEVVAVDVATGKILAKARASSEPLASPDGRTIATVDLDKTIKLRELPNPAR